MPRLTAILLIGAWLGFAFASRVLTPEVTGMLALAGIAATLAVLALSGHISRPDPLSLNLTGRRPYWETR
ncbi:MAG: hypothetical protein GC187_07115 [Alphaproteobacteria bacterium]|nr:hypothetical protein [Alphaproteobacteria bacterium]